MYDWCSRSGDTSPQIALYGTRLHPAGKLPVAQCYSQISTALLLDMAEPFLSLKASLAAVRAAAVTVRDLCKRARNGPRRFANVDKVVANLLSLVDAIDLSLKAHFENSPLKTAPNFLMTVRKAKEDLVIAADVTGAYCDGALGGTSNGDGTQSLDIQGILQSAEAVWTASSCHEDGRSPRPLR